jgi:hypothetical protein
VLSICLPTWRLTELEILLAGWPLGPGAAPLRYAHPATPTRNPPLPLLFIHTTPQARSPRPPRASPELRRRRCPIPQQRSHQHRRTSVDCPQIRRPAPRLPEAEAPTQPNPCIPRVRTPEEEEEEGGAAARRPPRRSLGDGGREAVGPRAAGGACRVHDVPALPGTSQGGHRHSPVPPHM